MPLPDQPVFFDPAAEYAVSEGHLPHWEQADVVAFITFRTWNSMPRDVIAGWLAERASWLKGHGIDPSTAGWEAALTRLPPDERAAFHRFCSARWNENLDRCHGSCPLRTLACSRVVTDSLRHFDGVRYTLFDFVVMPNHVHVLASFPETGKMREQCGSWKHFTAVRLNRLLGRNGRFWEEESFDHLVRSREQFLYFRDYIATNPERANLPPESYFRYSRPLTPTARGASGLHSGDPQ
jgi:putative transposase